MKKLLTLAAVVGAASVSFGQGYVNFANSTTTKIAINSVTGGPSTAYTGTAANGYYYALFVAPTTVTTSLAGSMTDPTTAGWTFTGAIGNNTASAGRLNGDTTSDGGVAVKAGPVQNIGDVGNYMVVGWSANEGTTWTAVQAALNGNALVGGGYFGESGMATGVIAGNTTGNPGPSTSPASLFSPGNGFINGFTLNLVTVPEPSTFALAGLGAAAMLIFRRRK